MVLPDAVSLIHKQFTLNLRFSNNFTNDHPDKSTAEIVLTLFKHLEDLGMQVAKLLFN